MAKIERPENLGVLVKRREATARCRKSGVGRALV
jgi:hypothetical protein